MSKIVFQSVSFKNFLTFGAREQTLDFEKGLSVVVGMDVERNRSNGSGKSSLLDTIPFALFGKTSRSVTKAQIINWKNKKNCSVKLVFHKDDIKYTVARTIKPDSLLIYRNDVLIEPPANVRDYQQMFEDTILGFDFATFMSLLHVNLNSIQPILKMSTPQKRAFLERIFGLGMFSDLVVKSNEKIRSIQGSITQQRLFQDFNNQIITDQETQHAKLKSRFTALPNTENDIRDLKERILALKDKHENPEERSAVLQGKIDKAKTLLDELTKTILVSRGVYNGMKGEYDLLEKQLKTYGNVDADIELLKQARKVFTEEFGSGASVVQERLELDNRHLALVTDKEKAAKLITELKVEHQALQSDKKNIWSQLELLQGDKCPTCQGELKDNKLLEELRLKYDMVCKHDIIRVGELTGAEIQQEQRLQDIKDVKENLLRVEKRILEHDRLKTQMERLSPSETKQFEYIALKLDLTDRENKLNAELLALQKLELESKTQTNIIKSSTDELESLQSAVTNLSNLKEQLERLETRLQDDIINRSDLQNMMDECDQRIRELVGTNRDATNKINKLNDLLDYVQYAKEMCQDDGAKQFAASSYMPYLTSRVNHYLSESGCNFYVKLTGWLDEEIMGAGISNCTYGNLSGGETRSIDIALQLAFLDIARIKAGVFPDLMVFDELLDSSVDGPGITSMMRIIKTLQREIDGKVFLITHRSEISDIDIDNMYVVEKSEGFSHVRKV